jgi:quercetin dioxygenase-like cupin family protein
MRPGDTVHTPAGEWHWHGAAPDHFMTHLATSGAPGPGEGPAVTWGDHITDEEYNAKAASALGGKGSTS